MSRKIFILLAIVVVLLYAVGMNGENWKEENPCGKNEYWSSCRASCESSCGFPNGPHCLKKTSGCVCRKGLVRDSKRNCINPSECGDERRGPVLFDNSD